MSHCFFAYGTLQFPAVLEHAIGMTLPGTPARLADYRCLRFRGGDFPGAIECSGHSVEGMLYPGVDDALLARLDTFEGDLYVRRALAVEAELTSRTAFVYVVDARYRDRFAGDWNRSEFERWHLSAFLGRLAKGRYP